MSDAWGTVGSNVYFVDSIGEIPLFLESWWENSTPGVTFSSQNAYRALMNLLNHSIQLAFRLLRLRGNAGRRLQMFPRLPHKA